MISVKLTCNAPKDTSVNITSVREQNQNVFMIKIVLILMTSACIVQSAWKVNVVSLLEEIVNKTSIAIFKT